MADAATLRIRAAATRMIRVRVLPAVVKTRKRLKPTEKG
jgi:hypothetical protein